MAPRRLLAVWAHPDDEAFGPVGTMRLAHDQGWQTAILTATQGDAGQSAKADLSPGQTLGEVREAELRAACAVLGVDHLQVWRYPDGGLQDIPQDELRSRVLDVMLDWQPHVVITFGLDGITGHPDHIAISAATRHAFAQLQSEPAIQLRRLYYVTVRPGRQIENRMGAAPPPAAPTSVVDVSRYEAVKRGALACHASQKDEWEPLLADHDWLTVDRFFRALPPTEPGTPIEMTILHE
ncbi:MAG: PIG-L family deacetylase [Chloroflexi bacterium]|nr:MAG: PIG-L family deacetylase [Chloroflexota bacterium]